MAATGYVVERCSNCRYYRWVAQRGSRCRRFPPAADGSFPAVAEEAWCGEWKEHRQDQPMFIEQGPSGGGGLPAVRRPRRQTTDVG